jgi:hypothetical protein
VTSSGLHLNSTALEWLDSVLPANVIIGPFHPISVRNTTQKGIVTHCPIPSQRSDNLLKYMVFLL